MITLCTQCTTDPSHQANAPASSPPGAILYLIPNYVLCDRFSEKHKAFLAAVTSDVAPKTYAEWLNLKNGVKLWDMRLMLWN